MSSRVRGFVIALLAGASGCGGVKTQKDSATPSFAPTDLSGLKFWVKAEAYDSGAATWPLAVGSTFTTDTTLFTTAGPQGQAAVTFDGSSHGFLNSSGLGTLTGLTFFVVGKETGTGDFFGISSGTSFGGIDSWIRLMSAGGHNFFAELGSSGIPHVSGTISADGNFWIHRVRWSASSDEISLAIFGKTSTTGTPGVSSLDLGGKAFIGSAAADLNGSISEVLFYDRALADAEESKVHTYLSGRYGLP